jgi:chromosome segregation ATPase
MAPKAKPAAAKAKADAKAKPKKVKEEASPEDIIPKVAKPDPKEYETRLEAVQFDIEGLQKKQSDLNARISERSGGKDDYMSKRNELRAELDKWSGLMDDCKSKKRRNIKKARGRTSGSNGHAFAAEQNEKVNRLYQRG